MHYVETCFKFELNYEWPFLRNVLNSIWINVNYGYSRSIRWPPKHTPPESSQFKCALRKIRDELWQRLRKYVLFALVSFARRWVELRKQVPCVCLYSLFWLQFIIFVIEKAPALAKRWQRRLFSLVLARKQTEVFRADVAGMWVISVVA